MRQISIHRYKAKVRGVERRLRSLEKWAKEFENIEPIYEGQKFWNYKIPVLDRLVNPPTTNKEIQSRALKSLINAAENLSNSRIKNELPYYRVAVLITFPNMFYSEVTAFYDKEYYDSFYYIHNQLPVENSPCSVLGVHKPPNLNEVGTLVEWEDEYGDGEIVKYSEERWTIGQKP